MNALADILGAYMQKKNLEGAMDYADNYQKNLDDQTAQKYIQNPVQPEQNGTNAMNGAIRDMTNSGQLVNTDWLGKNKVQASSDPGTAALQNYVPTSGGVLAAAQNYFPKDTAVGVANSLGDNVPAGTQQAAQTAQQPAQGQSILQMMQGFSDRNNPNNPPVMSPDEKAAQQKQYDDFAAAKKANPEWYVGDTYVGTDDKAKAQAQAQQAQQAQVKAQQDQQKAAIFSQGNNPENGRFSSGMEQYGFTGQKTAPLSYQKAAANKNQYKARAMKELVGKYGIEAAKQVEPMIDDAIGSKLGEMADSEDNQNRLALGRYLMSNNVNTQQGMQKALWAAEEYNHAAKQMGRQGIDTAMLGKMLDAGKVSITAKDVGGSVNFYAVPKDGGQFNDGSFMKPILAQNKTLSPGETVNANLKQAQMQETARHNQATESNTRRGQDMTAATARARAASGGRSGSTSFKAQYGPVVSAMTKSIEDGHSKSYIYTQFCDAGGTEEEWNKLWTGSVENYYHKMQGDDADDSRNYLNGDGEPEQ
jgi:hypothetical protein